MKTPEQAWADIRSAQYLVDIAKRLEISRAAVSAWKRVPAERVLALSAILGVPKEDLRPDLYPTPVPDPWNL
jgi:DNA-binding transcriptional regulator YdaS (Cro superfamily)